VGRRPASRDSRLARRFEVPSATPCRVAVRRYWR
jgi:hypothetical protein